MDGLSCVQSWQFLLQADATKIEVDRLLQHNPLSHLEFIDTRYLQIANGHIQITGKWKYSNIIIRGELREGIEDTKLIDMTFGECFANNFIPLLVLHQPLKPVELLIRKTRI